MPSLATVLKGTALFLPSLASAAGQLGFSLGTVKPDGSCKTPDDLIADLNAMKAETGATVVRTYAMSPGPEGGCQTAEILVPALKATGTKCYFGVWPVGYFDQEKAELNSVLDRYGTDQIAGLTVGSEALYRDYISASDLGNAIKDVRTLVQNHGKNVPIGFADTWNKIADGTADPAIQASDFVMANAFSFWQAQAMDNSTHSLFDDVSQALGHVQKVNSKAAFMVGETNWPTHGANYGAAVPGTDNAQEYWKSGICGLQKWGVDVFVFELLDEPQKSDEHGNDVEQHWGVLDVNRKKKYDLSC